MGQVVSLRQVADDLQLGLNQIVKTGAPNPDTEKEKVARISGYFFATVILRALATELALKALSFKKTGRYRKDGKGHDLRTLFNDLDDDTKKIIDDLEGVYGVAPLEQILEKHRSDFVDWRYLMEADDIRVDLLDLDKALDILITLNNHKEFLRLCALGSDT